MPNTALKVLSTINAPYGTHLTAEQLAASISDMPGVDRFDASAFAFFSEVEVGLQREFIAETGVDLSKALAIAARFSELAGYRMPLAEPPPGMRD